MLDLVPVAAGIIIKDGKIFIARRSRPGDPLASTWEFPGGKIRPGESPEECLKRELFEELNITVEVREYVGECIYHYPHVSIRLMAYRCSWVSGELKLTEHEAFAWVSPGDLAGYNLSPADMIIAEKLVHNQGSQ